MLSRFHLISEHYGQTDGRTDGQTDRRTDRFAVSISRVSMLTRDKNCAVGIMSKLTIQTNTKHRAASLRQLSFLLSCVSTRTRDIDIAILSVCLSVRPSVCP